MRARQRLIPRKDSALCQGKRQSQGKIRRAPGHTHLYPGDPGRSYVNCQVKETGQVSWSRGYFTYHLLPHSVSQTAAAVQEVHTEWDPVCPWGSPRASSWSSPVIVLEPGPPVGGPKECLNSTGQVHKQVTHQEEPATHRSGWRRWLHWKLVSWCQAVAWIQELVHQRLSAGGCNKTTHPPLLLSTSKVW